VRGTYGMGCSFAGEMWSQTRTQKTRTWE
jgi:hypothetical protein